MKYKVGQRWYFKDEPETRFLVKSVTPPYAVIHVSTNDRVDFDQDIDERWESTYGPLYSLDKPDLIRKYITLLK